MGPAGLRVDARRGLPLPLPPLLPPLLLLLLLLPPPAPGVTCPPPSAIEHADIQVRSHRQGSRERYACYSGFKRKAGTSSLTECVYNETTRTARWTRPTLQCIRDPSLAPRQPPSTSTAAPAAVTAELQSPSPTGKGTFTHQRQSAWIRARPDLAIGSADIRG
ncbi:interleukin-15 receptor subunit alpha [Sorex fumeus]|uniref:interleukin-15 receptor subunit alpha n=1 Tax=Sorex fumeus TaxID=62283 RepID=UPI0024AE5847|nr:interleukin-15 receptor subunit alpha [Sorex fumeus]